MESAWQTGLCKVNHTEEIKARTVDQLNAVFEVILKKARNTLVEGFSDGKLVILPEELQKPIATKILHQLAKSLNFCLDLSLALGWSALDTLQVEIKPISTFISDHFPPDLRSM